MKKILFGLFLVMLSVMLIACGTDLDDTEGDIDQDDQTTEEDEQQAEESDEPDESDEQEEPVIDDDEEGYLEVEENGSYVPYLSIGYDENAEFVLYSVIDNSDTQMRAEALKESLQLSDPTVSESFLTLEEVTIENNMAHLYFNEDHSFQSLASAEHMMLDAVLDRLGGLFGIDGYALFEGESPGLDYGQVGFVETISVTFGHTNGLVLLTDDNLRGEAPHVAFRAIKDFQEDGDSLTIEQVLSGQGNIEEAGYQGLLDDNIESFTYEDNHLDVYLTERSDEMTHVLVILAYDYQLASLTIYDEMNNEQITHRFPFE